MNTEINSAKKEEKLKFKYNKKSKLNRKEWISSYLFLLPAGIFFITFVVVPMFDGILISFQDYTLRGSKWIGLDNYISIFRDPIFIKSLGNTLLWF